MRVQPPAFMRVFLLLSAAEEERLAEGKEEKEGATKRSQGAGNRIRPLPERAARTHAGQIPGLTVPRNHQEARSRVDTTGPERQAGTPRRASFNPVHAGQNITYKIHRETRLAFQIIKRQSEFSPSVKRRYFTFLPPGSATWTRRSGRRCSTPRN